MGKGQVKVSKELCIRHVPVPAAHDSGITGDVVMKGGISEMMLVQNMQAREMGCRTCFRHYTLPLLPHCCHIFRRFCTVFSQMSSFWARASSCTMLPANSSSLLVMVPIGLLDNMRHWATYGKGLHRIIGSIPSSGSSTKRMSPMSPIAASWAPMLDGISAGTILAKRVGGWDMYWASHRKSRSVAWTGLIRRVQEEASH
jgi:hypothetical protein